MNFTVRVELHGVRHDSEKYTELHQEMAKQGLNRTITLDDGKYELPTAEYSRVSEETREQILNKAKLAAKEVMKSDRAYSVLVTGAENPRLHYNLKKIGESNLPSNKPSFLGLPHPTPQSLLTEGRFVQEPVQGQRAIGYGSNWALTPRIVARKP